MSTRLPGPQAIMNRGVELERLAAQAETEEQRQRLLEKADDLWVDFVKACTRHSHEARRVYLRNTTNTPRSVQ